MSKTLQGSETETKSYWEERNWKISVPDKGSFLCKIAIQANQWFITAMASLIFYCLWLPWANFLECMTYFLAGFEGSMEKGAWLQIGRGKTSRTDRRENDDKITNQSRGPTIMGVLPWQGDSFNIPISKFVPCLCWFLAFWPLNLLCFQERAEWINSIIQQLWFNIGNYTRKIIAESVEPAVSLSQKWSYF